MDVRVGEPLFLPAGEAALFACLHGAGGPQVSDCVLLLPPHGHEYFATHRSLRHCAQRLAERGCLALRVDLHGCGDAGGEKDSGTLARWCEDGLHAVTLLRERAPTARLHLLGARLGAVLAAQLAARLAAQDTPAASLLLWDAIDDGRAWLAAQLALHAARHGGRQGVDDPGPVEILGHSLSPTLLTELRALRLASCLAAARPRVLWLTSTPTAGADALRARGLTVEERVVASPNLWSGDGQVALVPTDLLNHAIKWVLES